MVLEVPLLSGLSYLSNRQQYAQIHKTKFDTKPITCGIPHRL